MSIDELVEKRKYEKITDIVQSDELTTMEKLNAITGDNYFTNANRAKGIYLLLQENVQEINNSEYMQSVFAGHIKWDCLVDFKRIVATQGDGDIIFVYLF